MVLSNSHYNTIMREYDDLRAYNRGILREREEEVDRVIPEFAKLNKKVGIITKQYYLEAMKGNKEISYKSFKQDIDYVIKRKKRLLQENGFSEEYLEPIYKCKLCKDTGTVDDERCSCFKAKELKMLYKQSNLEKVLERENFSKFSFNYYDNTQIIEELEMTSLSFMKKIVKMSQKYIENFGKTSGSILFMGNTGVGKTFISNCIAKEIMDKGFSVLYFTAADIFNILAKEKLRKDSEQSENSDFITECDLLIIDDLGTELSNSFTVSELFTIINGRDIKQKSTIISTNLDLNSLRDIYSERITSRIISKYDIITLYGDDIREMIPHF